MASLVIAFFLIFLCFLFPPFKEIFKGISITQVDLILSELSFIPPMKFIKLKDFKTSCYENLKDFVQDYKGPFVR